MRSFAISLRARAEKIAARAARLGHRVDRMKFEGPAAEDFRQRMLTARRDAESAAADLKDMANYLLSQAANLETLIVEWERRRAAAAEGGSVR